MENPFDRQESGKQQPSVFLAGLKIFDGILHWLVGLFQLTEEEQENAGIYFDDQHDR